MTFDPNKKKMKVDTIAFTADNYSLLPRRNSRTPTRSRSRSRHKGGVSSRPRKEQVEYSKAKKASPSRGRKHRKSLSREASHARNTLTSPAQSRPLQQACQCLLPTSSPIGFSYTPERTYDCLPHRSRCRSLPSFHSFFCPSTIRPGGRSVSKYKFQIRSYYSCRTQANRHH